MGAGGRSVCLAWALLNYCLDGLAWVWPNDALLDVWFPKLVICESKPLAVRGQTGVPGQKDVAFELGFSQVHHIHIHP